MSDSKSVIIVGGGVAGLTCATLLAEKGLKVTIIEASDIFGGKAHSRYDVNHLPLEHADRIYQLSCYPHLAEIMFKLPYDHQKKVIDNMVPLPQYLYSGETKQTLIKLISRKTNSNASILKKLFWPLIYPFALTFNTIKISFSFFNYFRTNGIGLTEQLHWGYKHLRICFMCKERVVAELSKISYEDYLNVKDRSKAYSQILAGIPNRLFGANIPSQALASVFCTLETTFATKLFCPMEKANLQLNGPTGEKLIDPWVTMLKNKGVVFITNTRIIDFLYDKDQFSSVLTSDGKKFEADFFILATSLIELIFLSKKSILKKHCPSLDNIEKLFSTLNWTHGLQIFLSDIPESLRKEGIHSTTGCLFADAPWGIVGILKDESHWSCGDPKFPQKINYLLTLAISNPQAKGIIFKKPFLECNKEEIFVECLEQIKVGHKNNLIIHMHLDENLVFMDNDTYNTEMNNLPGHLAYKTTNGNYLLNFMPVFYPLPESDQYIPDTKIGKNFYLAGEYLKTNMFMPVTMEKSCEAGYRAVNDCLNDIGFAPKDLFKIHENDSLLPFRWIRKIDKFFFAKKKKRNA